MDNLDNLGLKLTTDLGISKATDIYNPHKAMCKRKSYSQSQEERRIRFLQNLKQKRQECLFKIRRLTGIDILNSYDSEHDQDISQPEVGEVIPSWDPEISDTSSDLPVNSSNSHSENLKRRIHRRQRKRDEKTQAESLVEAMDSNSSESQRSDGPKKSISPYKDQLMLSEWMLEKPSDLDQNWLLVICPVGKRCLILSSNGQTRVYTRSGHFMKAFPSYLPGGNRRDSTAFTQSAILDCIFSEVEKTIYILDVMLWNQTQFYDSETELRFYWLSTKIREEYSHISSLGQLNPYKFRLLDHFICDKESIISAVQSYSLKPKIDGLLFFHKKCHYFPEVTPLVCWLKLNMIQDILGFEVNLPIRMELEMEA